MKRILNPWLRKLGYQCICCCPTNERGLKMVFYEDGDDIVSYWEPQPSFQGWIDTLHGGVQAMLLDEICGWTVSRKLQTTGVTSRMETRYLKPVKTTDSKLTIRARLVDLKRNIATIDAELYDSSGTVCTKATCTYFCATKEKAAEEMGFHGCKVEGEEE